MSCSVTSLASSSAAYRQAGRSRCSPHSSYSVAKFALNAFATGAFVCALTSCANDSYCSFRPANAFAASIAILPSSPLTLPSASEMEPEGTATNTTSASEPSPPSRPSAVTSCPACSHSRASPAPTLPLPMTTMFRVRTLPPPSMPHPASRLTRRRGAQTRPSGLPARRVPAWRRPLAVSGEPLPVRNRVAARAVREACRSGTVAAYRVQLEAAAAVRCEHDLGAVGRPRRVPVVRGVPRQVRWTPPLAVHDEDVVAAVPIAREGQTVPARGPRRVEVGGCALIRDVLLAAPVRIHHVDLRVSVAARLEGDSIAARRPRRHRVDAGGTREPAHVAAVGVHRVDLEVPVAAIAVPGKLPSVRRPRGVEIVRGVVRELPNVTAVGVRDVDLEVPVPIGHERKSAPVGGPHGLQVGGGIGAQRADWTAWRQHSDVTASRSGRREGNEAVSAGNGGAGRGDARAGGRGGAGDDDDLPDSPSRRRQRLSPFASVPNPASTPQH